MGKSHPMLGNGSRRDPFSHMRNISFLASFVVPAEIYAVVVTTAVPRSTFEASFLLLPVRPVPGGPVYAARFPTTKVGLTYPSVMFLAFSTGVGTAGVNIVSNLFSNSSIWSTKLFGLFMVTTRTGSVSYSDSLTT